MKKQRITTLMLAFMLSTTITTVFGQDTNNSKMLKESVNPLIMNKDIEKCNEADMVYAGGSKYFDETTGQYKEESEITIKGIVKSVDNSIKDPELAGETKIFTVESKQGTFMVNVSIFNNPEIIGGYENIKEGIEIEVSGELRKTHTPVIVADKVIVGTKEVNNKKSSIFEITDYEIIEQDIEQNKQLGDWILENFKNKGIYYKNYNDKNYVLIAAGECNTGGYSIKVNRLYTKNDSKNILYVDAEVEAPGKDMSTIQVITYPYTLIELNTNENYNKVLNVSEIYDSTTIGDIKDIYNSTNNPSEKLNMIQKVIQFIQELIN